MPLENAAKLENVLGLATVVATLLRLRARACVVLACLAAMLFTASLASANPSVQPKTRVWDFSFAEPLNTCPNAPASPRLHLENRSSSAEPALGSPHAARGSNTAFEIAKAGGRHSGQLEQFLKQTPDQRRRSIGSFEKNIAKHEGWIKDPTSKVKNWGELSAEHQGNLLHHWGQDISRARELKSIAEGVLGGL